MTLLPRFFRVGQTFARPTIDDLGGEVYRQLVQIGLDQRVAPGQTVAITGGSRGIANVAAIAKLCVDYFKQLGAQPYIIPAMGSHGGATAEGQAKVLASYGVTEALMGCPIRSSMEVI